MNKWSQLFSTSMLGDLPVLILCQEESDAEELMQILESYGIRWADGDLPTSRTHFNMRNPTVYFVEHKELTYGSVNYAESEYEYDHIKCTFYAATQEFEAADDNEFLAMIGGK